MVVVDSLGGVRLLFRIPNCMNLGNRLLSTVCRNVNIVTRFDDATANSVVLLVVIVVIVRLSVQRQNILCIEEDNMNSNIFNQPSLSKCGKGEHIAHRFLFFDECLVQLQLSQFAFVLFDAFLEH